MIENLQTTKSANHFYKQLQISANHTTSNLQHFKPSLQSLSSYIICNIKSELLVWVCMHHQQQANFNLQSQISSWSFNRSRKLWSASLEIENLHLKLFLHLQFKWWVSFLSLKKQFSLEIKINRGSEDEFSIFKQVWTCHA